MISISELPEIICNVRIYEDEQQIYEGKIDNFDFTKKAYVIDYISCSLSYTQHDKSESVDFFSVNAFVDIYVS